MGREATPTRPTTAYEAFPSPPLRLPLRLRPRPPRRPRPRGAACFGERARVSMFVLTIIPIASSHVGMFL